MGLPKRRLHMALQAFVRGLRRPGECVQHWTEDRPGEVRVQLIDRRLRRAGRRAAAPPGEEAGGGRVLLFRKVRGRWLLAGPGHWTLWHA